jgi:hypothetical protein
MLPDTQQTIELAKSIASALGSPWQHVAQDEPYPTQYIVNTENRDAEISVRLDYSNKSRVALSGSLHIGKNRQYVEVRENGERQTVPTVTVNLERGIGAVVQAINKRLLPEYLRLLALAQKQVAAENDYHSKVRGILNRLAPLVNESTAKLQDEASSLSFYHSTKGHGSIQAHGDGTVSLDLNSISEEKAKRILALL